MATPESLSFVDRAAAFSVAAAHGITSRVIGTWSPHVIRNPRVLVPVQVDALVVRPQTAATKWADCKLKPRPNTPDKVTRRDILPDPFAELDGSRPPGVYLHWALPDGLTHATASGDTATFPAAPDRWLILRMYPSAAGPARRAVTGWVLRAGDENPIPIDLDKFIEGAPSQAAIDNPFTALGKGDVSWAAYYDNVVNRLGFYDSVQGISTGPLAYLVCGWYSNPTQDPLGAPAVSSLTAFNAKLSELNWRIADGELNEAVKHSRRFAVAAGRLGLRTYSIETTSAFDTFNTTPSFPAVDAGGEALGPYTTDGSWWPKATLCHGSVVAIGWPGLGWPGNERGVLSGEVGGAPAAASVNVAMGNTMAEALAALVAQKNKSPQEARILEAFMCGVLPELDHPDGRARLDDQLHASTFASIDGGHTTETIWIPQVPDNPSPLPKPVTPGPGVFPQPPVKFHDQAFQSGRFSEVSVQLGGQTRAKNYSSLETQREVNILSGGLAAAMRDTVKAPPVTVIPGHFEDVQRALPRYFFPSEPVILVEGAGRTFKHGGDNRLTQDDTLTCRLTGFVVTELSCNAITGQPNRPSARGEDVLERGVENGSVPPECEDLLRETLILDPGAAEALANVSTGVTTGTTTVSAAAIRATASNFMVEQTVWWATRDPRVDHAPLATLSGISGTLPAPIAISAPVKPWNPLHLDWKLLYIPSANEAKDWTLGEVDYSPDPQKIPSTDDAQQSLVLQGRAHLTGGAATTTAANLRRALDQALAAGGAANLPPNTLSRFHSQVAQQLLDSYAALTTQIKVSTTGAADTTGAAGGDNQIPPIDRGPLEDILTALESMDVLTGALDGFTFQLRGGFDPDGISKPADGSMPSPFIPLRSGFIQLLRLRLVDCFGQFIDLAGSSATTSVDPTLLIESEPVQVDQHPQLIALPPRFTSPSRLWVRFMAADASEQEANATISPICGYLMPNHLDGALEFFDVDGTNLGIVRPEPTAGIVWEEAPGRPSTVGQSPLRAIPNSFAAGIAQGLLQWGTADATQDTLKEDALSALLRIIDSTLWAVDPFGHTGDEHLSLLVGHPVAIMRARVRLEVKEPIHPETLATLAISLRLGALEHWQDGLLGYFVNDDYTRLYCADAAVAGFAREVGPGRGFLQPASLVSDFYQTFSDDLGVGVTQGSSPVDHPYVDGSGVLTIRPNQEISLTLLVEPQTAVHATSGMLPRKDVGMRREWVAAALARLAPTFTFGPLLVDVKKIRMPVPTEIAGTWSWDHRADTTTWEEDPIVNATQDALLRPDPATGTEGWLRMVPPEPKSGS
jgi:hypothetical protein